MTEKLSIIIPAFAGLRQTGRCLQPLGSSDFQDFRAIIIGMTSCFLLGFQTLVPPAIWYRFRYPDGLVPTSLIGGAR